MGSPYHECLGKAAPLVWIDHDQLLKTANRQAPLRACFLRHKSSPNSSFTYPSVCLKKEAKGKPQGNNRVQYLAAVPYMRRDGATIYR